MAAPGNKRKFGLILASARREQAGRSVAGAGGVRRLNPLRDSDDELEAGDEEEQQQQQAEEEENTMDWVQAALKKSGGGNSAQLAQQQRLMREALEEDSSVFQYDELYDDMQAGRDTAKQEKKQQQKKPKFIHNILKSAERRKLEKEQRTERKVQREREEEKGLYDDKESFVTPAYLAKLEELKQAEARERMEALVEEKNDVAKHKNMGLFYQHLYKQRMGEDSNPDVVKTEPPEEETQEGKDAAKTGNENPTPEASGDGASNSDITIRRRDQRSKANKYRAQRDIDDSPTREESPSQSSRKRQKSGRQISDGSSDSESERRSYKRRKSSQPESPERRSKSPVKRKSSPNPRSPISRKSSQSPSKSKSSSSKNIEGKVKIKDEPESSSEEVDSSKETKKNEKKEKKSKVSINKPVESKESRDERIKKLFTKRCVGEKFIEAQQRYFQRRAERESSGVKGL